MSFTTNDIPTLTLGFAQEYLGDRPSRTLSNNTEILGTSVRTEYHGTFGGYSVRLHWTNIVTITGPEDEPDRFYFLDFKGYWTATTIQRANQVLPWPLGLWSSKGTLMIGSDQWSHPYHDGFVIDRRTMRPTFGTLHSDTADIFQTNREG